MKTLVKTTAILIILIIYSCTTEKKLLKVDVKKNENKQLLAVSPKMEFRIVNDSAFYYFDQEDYRRILSGDIRIGKEIYSNSNFKVKVILREHLSLQNTQYEMVIRTYGEDFRIIDSFVIGSTIDGKICEGYITENLEVMRNCDGESTVDGYINGLGKFIIPE